MLTWSWQNGWCRNNLWLKIHVQWKSKSSDAFISGQCNSVSMATSPWVFRIATLHLNFFPPYSIGISNKPRKHGVYKISDVPWSVPCWQLHLLPEIWKDGDALVRRDVPARTGDTAEKQDKIVMKLVVYLWGSCSIFLGYFLLLLRAVWIY